MTTRQKALVLVGLSVAAMAAAVPFRRDTSELETTAMAGSRLSRNWRGQSPVVPLQLTAEDGAFPVEFVKPTSDRTQSEPPSRPSTESASTVRPPAISRSYQPLMAEIDEPYFARSSAAASFDWPVDGFRSVVKIEPPRERRHRITDGDTLPGLAERYLGDAARYREIFEANRYVLPSPNVLPIGGEIIIPPRSSAGLIENDPST